MKKGNWYVIGIITVVIFLIVTYAFEIELRKEKTQDVGKLKVQELSVEEVAALKESHTLDGGIVGEVVETVDADASVKTTDIQSKESDIKWRSSTVYIEESASAYIVLEYTNISDKPAAALAYSPDFSLCVSPSYIEDGKILFYLKNPVPGEWTVRISGEMNLGTYSLYALEKEAYEALYAPNTQVPRDLECEGAQIDE